MNHPTNRIAALLEGCPDPGGVLYPAIPSFRSPHRSPVPKVVQLVLPAAGLSLRALAALLGVSPGALQCERIALGVFSPLSVPLDFTAASQLCARLGVSVAPAA